ncbi:uncharacterized protein KY384_006282 [Bacidia gigantensis]|uniref:uncharacterized protein n=1 Tax=Bacidia gigantensis TaxID=2732470 RepID=UPI001D0582AE|nr:uncharacterized protein KY384_006282 [Bacidia gigantensis]KAG8528595.1 hypothetical protein KY384_006282 [Bacidia gigantensis]
MLAADSGPLRYRLVAAFESTNALSKPIFIPLMFNMKSLFAILLFVASVLGQANDSAVVPSEPDGEDSIDVPDYSIQNKTAAANGRLLQDGRSLRFRSSTRVIMGSRGEKLYATLMPAKQIHAILTHAKQDLASYHELYSTTFYQYNFTDWAFEVRAYNDTPIPFASIAGIVHRLLVLLPDPATDELTFARVGHLLRGDTILAQQAFIPLSPDVEIDPTYQQMQLSGGVDNNPLVYQFTPNGSANVEPSSINTRTLLNFINSTAPAATPQLPQDDLAVAEASRNLTNYLIGSFLVTFTYDVWLERPENRPVIVVVSPPLLSAAVSAWYTSICFEYLDDENMPFPNALNTAESTAWMKEYHVGRLLLRIVIRTYNIWTHEDHRLTVIDIVEGLLQGLWDHLRGLPVGQKVPVLSGPVSVDVPDPTNLGHTITVKAAEYNITAAEVEAAIFTDDLK